MRETVLDTALLAIDYAAVAAADLQTALTAAAAGRPEDMQGALRKALRLLSECDKAINEALPIAAQYFERSP